jgi:hypothetical protein
VRLGHLPLGRLGIGRKGEVHELRGGGGDHAHAPAIVGPLFRGGL